MSHDAVSDQQLTNFLNQHPDWKVDDHKLKAEFKFADFKQTFAFMTVVAGEAERLNHHPNWTNVYNRVIFELWTHETGGISQHDLELAAAIVEAAHA